MEIRPITPADAPEIEAGFDQLSPTSRRMRFFTPMPRLPASLLRWMTNADQHDHIALMAVDDGAGIGTAHATRRRDDASAAEVAVDVLDARHRQGVGSALMRELRRAAVLEGIDAFEGHVLVDNTSALAWLRSAGAELDLDEPGVLRFHIPLDRPPEPVAA
jgi:ribosomal protein S18 acetylase RimI-like enzyme